MTTGWRDGQQSWQHHAALMLPNRTAKAKVRENSPMMLNGSMMIVGRKYSF
jgi:hypothetical protein